MKIFMGSYVSLWIIVVLLSLTLLALSRQIAILHGRLSQAGARMTNTGPQIGASITPFRAPDLVTGEHINIPAIDQRNTLLVFLSPGCSTCDRLIPALTSIAEQEKKRAAVVVASFNGDDDINLASARKHQMSELAYILSNDLARTLGVSSTPYVVLIDAVGIVRSKGMANNREHLDSVLNVIDTGYLSSDSYWATQAKSAQAG